MVAPRRPLLSFAALSAPLVATISLGCNNGDTSGDAGVCNAVCDITTGAYSTGPGHAPESWSSSATPETGTSTDAMGTGTEATDTTDTTGTDATGTDTNATGTDTDATGTDTNATGTDTNATGTGTTGTSGG